MSINNLTSKVIQNGYCVGCGACAAVAPLQLQIAIDQRGCYQAIPLPTKIEIPPVDPEKVCPFSEISRSEDELAAEFLPDCSNHDKKIGRYLKCFVGKVLDPALYQSSSSGGLGRWLLASLVDGGLVDRVIHVTGGETAASGGPLFEYAVAETCDQVLKGSKSAYYPVEMSKVLLYIKSNPGTYAITGVPCFIKAVRHLMLLDPDFRTRIKFTIGIVCGHLKSKYYAEMIGWQMGVIPSRLGGIDFRVKIPGCKANEKGIQVVDSKDPTKVIPPTTVQKLFGTNYGHGYFKYNACDYCDDVLAETADISVGDAWLPEYLHEGTSIVTVRNRALLELIETGVKDGSLQLREVPAIEVSKSQKSGLRHRREGLAYRILLKKEENLWFPPKRVVPSSAGLTGREQSIHRMRLVLARQSFEHFNIAKAAGRWDLFESPMLRLNARYTRLYRGHFSWARRAIKWILARIGIRTGKALEN